MSMLKDNNFKEQTMKDSTSLLKNLNINDNTNDFKETENILEEINKNENENEDKDEDLNNNINLNINDYTKEDLYNILDLENPSSNEIKIKINFLKNTLFSNNNNIKNFLSNVEEKLLEEKNTIEEFSNLILYKDNNKEYDFEVENEEEYNEKEYNEEEYNEEEYNGKEYNGEEYNEEEYNEENIEQENIEQENIEEMKI